MQTVFENEFLVHEFEKYVDSNKSYEGRTKLLSEFLDYLNEYNDFGIGVLNPVKIGNYKMNLMVYPSTELDFFEENESAISIQDIDRYFLGVDLGNNQSQAELACKDILQAFSDSLDYQDGQDIEDIKDTVDSLIYTVDNEINGVNYKYGNLLEFVFTIQDEF